MRSRVHFLAGLQVIMAEEQVTDEDRFRQLLKQSVSVWHDLSLGIPPDDVLRRLLKHYAPVDIVAEWPIYTGEGADLLAARLLAIRPTNMGKRSIDHVPRPGLRVLVAQREVTPSDPDWVLVAVRALGDIGGAPFMQGTMEDAIDLLHTMVAADPDILQKALDYAAVPDSNVAAGIKLMHRLVQEQATSAAAAADNDEADTLLPDDHGSAMQGQQH